MAVPIILRCSSSWVPLTTARYFQPLTTARLHALASPEIDVACRMGMVLRKEPSSVRTRSVAEAGRVLEMATALEKKFAGKPFVVIGVNNDTRDNLREMQKQADLVTFLNFSDPENRLAREYRIGSWPLAYVLDGERKIHYAGQPGSFVELAASALLDEAKPAK